jgi:hypothetical protein
VDDITSPVALETMACAESMSLPAGLKSTKFTVSSDCLAVIRNSRVHRVVALIAW